MSDEISREYQNLVTGERAGSYAGTARDDAFRSDVHWKLIDGTPVDEPTAEAPETEGDGETDIDKLSRDELNTLAESLGVEDPAALGNKQEVKDAIAKAHSEPGEAPETEED